MAYTVMSLPPQQLPLSKKNTAWRKKHLDWATDRTFFNDALIRNTVSHMKINYDLIDGKLNMKDLALIINPESLSVNYIPDKIQHYPIMNTKLEILEGEELSRVFDYKVIVTNPNSISEIENNKKQQVLERLQEWIQKSSQSEEESQKELESINQYFSYEWQDAREMRANELLHHYMKELSIPMIFSDGFKDALIVGEEMYQCDIIGGEPTIERLNPMKVRIFQSGYSNKVEDADVIVLEDYWSPGRIIDTYFDSPDLNTKAIKYFDSLNDEGARFDVDSMDNIDDRYTFVHNDIFADEAEGNYWNSVWNNSMPYDMAGNVRVLRIYWKSRRKIKKIRSYDPITGEEIFDFYDESYIPDKNKGEEETIYYINQAWEGTKIGEDIYVNMRPKIIQYNRLSNPSKCHFGIIGTIYNTNDNKPFSLVDRMKPFSYLYDVIHSRLNELIARNWGTLVKLDFAKIPKEWTVDKWMYYARTMGLAVEDSFKEGTSGAALGKLSGGLNNASSGVIPTSDGNQIQQYTNLLEYIKMEMSEVAGISKQREGQVSNRETVGGVERATLQSSHITEGIFARHDDTKKRALECFLETAKIACKGRSKKFQYIQSDYTQKIIEIDGDEFAESDYGLVVDNSKGIQELNQKLDMLAQAALQNQLLDFSTIMKLYTSASLAEKQRMVETNEKATKKQAQQQAQQQTQVQQQQIEQQAQTAQAQMEQQYKIAQEKNKTAIQVAIINGEAEAQRFAMMNHDEEKEAYSEKDRAELAEKIRQFDEKLRLDRDKLAFDKDKAKTDAELKREQIKKQSANKSK